MKKEKILKEIKFAELMQKYPEAVEVLMNEGMHCFGCAMASYETLEEGCLAHGLDVNKVLKKLNKRKK